MMGNSLEQHRASFGAFNASSKRRRQIFSSRSSSLRVLIAATILLQLLVGVLCLLNRQLLFSTDWVPGKHYSLLLEMEEGVSFGPKNATPSQVVIKVRTGAEKRSFFGSLLKQNLLLREGIESNPGPVTIGETLAWYKNSCPNGKLAESEIKVESVKFFKLSGDDL